MYQGKFQDNVTPETPDVSQEMPVMKAPERRPPQRRRPPQGHRPPQRRRPSQRGKRTTTGTLLFYSIYLVVVLALFITISIAMGALKNWIPTILPDDKSQELSQVMFDRYFADPDWAALYKSTYPKATDEEVAKYVQKIQEYIGNKPLAFTETSAGISGNKKFIVHVDGIGIATFLLIPENPDDPNTKWYDGGVEIELFPAEPEKPVYLSYNIITVPGHTVTVNGKDLTEENVIRKVSTVAEDYLPDGVNGYGLIEYRIEGLKAEPTVAIKDKSGTAVEVTYNADTKTYTQVMGAAPTISSEDAEYQAILGAAKAWTEYAVKANTAGLKKYYDTSSQVYKNIISGEMFRQESKSHTFHPEEITEYYRYSDTLFSAKIKLDCTVVRKADGYNKLFTVDSTYIFQYTGSKWMVYDLVNVEIQEQVEEVRLTFKDAEGNVLSNEFVSSSIKILPLPTVEVPEGKVFAGWYMQTFDEEGGEMLNMMFLPDANNSVNLSGSTEALKSMTLVPMFNDATEGA